MFSITLPLLYVYPGLSGTGPFSANIRVRVFRHDMLTPVHEPTPGLRLIFPSVNDHDRVERDLVIQPFGHLEFDADTAGGYRLSVVFPVPHQLSAAVRLAPGNIVKPGVDRASADPQTIVAALSDLLVEPEPRHLIGNGGGSQRSRLFKSPRSAAGMFDRRPVIPAAGENIEMLSGGFFTS